MLFLIRLLALTVCLLIPATLFGQTRVRVTQDQVSIWNAGFFTVATVVDAGTELEVVRRRDAWFEVMLPMSVTAERRTGFVAAIQVELVEGVRGDVEPAVSQPPRPSASAPRPISRRAAAQLFAHVGYGSFAAKETFTAILGRSDGLWLGGGGRYTSSDGWFIQGLVERFRQSGERVFVFENEVFPLGLSDTVTITPVVVTWGKGFGDALRPYLGAGFAIYHLEETSEFAEASENVNGTKTGFHVLGGIELPIAANMRTGVEVQYSRIDRGLEGGLADAFDEHDLGGVRVRLKVLFGLQD
jgi:hypothetical protein